MSLRDERDEPVLRHLAEHPPQNNVLTTHRFATAPHDGMRALTQAQVHRAIETLHDAGYVSSDGEQLSGGGGSNWTDFQVTGAGKQALGLWPKFAARRASSQTFLMRSPTTHRPGGIFQPQARGRRCPASSARCRPGHRGRGTGRRARAVLGI